MGIVEDQKIEADRIVRLFKSVDESADDIAGLSHILQSYQGWHNDNPIKYIKKALRAYVQDMPI